MVHEPVSNFSSYSSPLVSSYLPSFTLTPTQHGVDLLFIMRLGSTFKISCCLTEGFFLSHDGGIHDWLYGFMLGVGCIYLYIYAYVYLYMYICIYAYMFIHKMKSFMLYCKVS